MHREGAPSIIHWPSARRTLRAQPDVTMGSLRRPALILAAALAFPVLLGAVPIPGHLLAQTQSQAPTPAPPQPQSPAQAQPQPLRAAPAAPLRLEATLPLDAEAQAVAVSADETVLAVALGEGPRWRVAVFDRTSRGRLGALAAEVGAHPRLRFSPVREHLLVAGDQAIELWELPMAALKPGEELPPRHRLWREALPGNGSLSEAALLEPAGRVLWSRGGRLHQRPLVADARADARAGAEIGARAVWPAKAISGELRFAVQAGVPVVAVYQPGEKWLELVEPAAFKGRARGEEHRFALGAAAVTAEGAVYSLDAGTALMRWQPAGGAESLGVVQGLPEGFAPLRLAPLAGSHLLLAGTAAGATQVLVLDAEKLTAREGARAGAPEQVAASPTGRYVLAAQGRELRLYRFGAALAPEAYVRRLLALKAARVARSYVSLLDVTGQPPGIKSQLLDLLAPPPGERILADFLVRLRGAVGERNPERMRYWAQQVLAVAPEQAEALHAIAEARRIEDGQALAQAELAQQQGRPREVIDLLATRFAPGHPLYGSAAALIQEAERQRAIETTLEQARDKLALGDYTAAQALVGEALRKNARHPGALALQQEIARRKGGLPGGLMALLLALTAAGAIVWLGVSRFRNRIRAWLSGIALEDTEPPRPRPHVVEPPPLPPERPPPEPRPPPRAAERPPPVRPAPAPQAPAPPAEPAREQPPQPPRPGAEELLERIEEMVRAYRLADVYRQHTTLFMELDAELNSIRRRLVERSLNPATIEPRLHDLLQHLRQLRFAPPPPAGGGADVEPESTHYEVLNLPETASEADIRKAYHRLLKQYHPDLHNHSSFAWVRAEAEKMSRRIGEAYQVLGNHDARLRYDRELRRKRGQSA
ncbi:MAG: J domain-containing protein [Candidatus Lambdaproteobacteria bacterium]|nr:J domain-containing protein [Candidatus Lambdaproteobacteria bacterium]